MASIRDVTGGAALGGSVLASVLAYPHLPERMAVHWDLGGNPDGWMATPLALALFPGLIAFVWALYAFDVRIDPLGHNVELFQRSHDQFAAVVVGFLAYVHGAIVLWNLGVQFGMVEALAVPLAVVYYATGRVLERAERNWMVGVRTPWTLESEAVWDRTHRRVAPLFKLVAPLSLLALFIPTELAVLVYVAPVLAVSAYAVAYSYREYRRLETGNL